MFNLRKHCLVLMLLALAFLPAGCGEDDVRSRAPSNRLSFSNGQAASVVIGQANFTANAINQGGAVAADTLSFPRGNPLVTDGRLYLGDSNNSRVLGFDSVPAVNGASAGFVIGQTDLLSSATGVNASNFGNPFSIHSDGVRGYVADSGNFRVVIYNSLPTATGAVADVAVGAPDLSTSSLACDPFDLFLPTMAYVVGGKLLVADLGHHRIMIWNSIPTVSGTAADLVLGQPLLSNCTSGLTASKMDSPKSVWSDGTRVMVADFGNNRVLIWNTFPTVNGQAADLVLGQPDMTSNAPATGADGLDNPTFLSVSKGQVFVSDTGNHRVLIWNSFPTATQQAANQVLGQPDFITSTSGSTANTLNTPRGVSRSGWDLLVSDTNNHRVLIYASQ